MYSFLFCFSCDARKFRIASFVIKSVEYSVWTFHNKSTFYNGREEASALIKYALHSIKGRVKLDFHRFSREFFVFGVSPVFVLCEMTLFFSF